MTTDDLARWRAAADGLDRREVRRLGLPFSVLLVEAEALAELVDKYWEPSADGELPGLEAVAAHLDRGIGEELLSLARACRTLHGRAKVPREERDDTHALVAEGKETIAAIIAACEFVLDPHDDSDTLRAIAHGKRRLAKDRTRATLVQALSDFSLIGRRVRDKLATLGTFDTCLVDRSSELADLLGSKRSPPVGKPASPHIAMRNRYLTLLTRRVKEVRRAVRYVFRDHPHIVRLATSAYTRRLQREHYRRKTAAAAAPTSDADSDA